MSGNGGTGRLQLPTGQIKVQLSKLNSQFHQKMKLQLPTGQIKVQLRFPEVELPVDELQLPTGQIKVQHMEMFTEYESTIR